MADALAKVAGYYRTNQPEIATRVLEARKRTGSAVARSAASLDAGLVDAVLEAVTSAYDPEYGGGGDPPQLPPNPPPPPLPQQTSPPPPPHAPPQAAPPPGAKAGRRPAP